MIVLQRKLAPILVLILLVLATFFFTFSSSETKESEPTVVTPKETRPALADGVREYVLRVSPEDMPKLRVGDRVDIDGFHPHGVYRSIVNDLVVIGITPGDSVALHLSASWPQVSRLELAKARRFDLVVARRIGEGCYDPTAELMHIENTLSIRRVIPKVGALPEVRYLLRGVQATAGTNSVGVSFDGQSLTFPIGDPVNRGEGMEVSMTAFDFGAIEILRNLGASIRPVTSETNTWEDRMDALVEWDLPPKSVDSSGLKPIGYLPEPKTKREVQYGDGFIGFSHWLVATGFYAPDEDATGDRVTWFTLQNRSDHFREGDRVDITQVIYVENHETRYGSQFNAIVRSAAQNALIRNVEELGETTRVAVLLPAKTSSIFDITGTEHTTLVRQNNAPPLEKWMIVDEAPFWFDVAPPALCTCHGNRGCMDRCGTKCRR